MPNFNIFHGAISEIEVQSFSIFPKWLPHQVTYDVILMIKTFYMSSCTYGENFISIRQAVAEKNTKVLCGQINKQRQTDRQMEPKAIPSPSTRVIPKAALYTTGRELGKGNRMSDCQISKVLNLLFEI